MSKTERTDGIYILPKLKSLDAYIQARKVLG